MRLVRHLADLRDFNRLRNSPNTVKTQTARRREGDQKSQQDQPPQPKTDARREPSPENPRDDQHQDKENRGLERNAKRQRKLRSQLFNHRIALSWNAVPSQ